MKIFAITIANVLALPAAIFLASCGGSGGSDVNSPSASPAPTISTGVLLDGPVSGINYRTQTQSGKTNASGNFSYRSGETVTFSVGAVNLPPVPAKATVTPLDMANTTDLNNQTVSNILVFLQSLDDDGDASNGLSISSKAHTASTKAMSFDVAPATFSANPVMLDLVAASGSRNTAPVSESSAKTHFQATLAANGVSTGGTASASTLPATTPAATSDPNMTVPLTTAFANMINNGLSGAFVVTGWVDNSTGSNPQPATPITGTGNLSAGSAVAATYKSSAALQATQVITTTIGGVSKSTTSTIIYSSNYSKLSQTAGSTTLVFTAYTIPATVKVGSAGSLGSAADAPLFATATVKESYTAASGDASSLLVTIISDQGTAGGLGGDQTATTYRVKTSGAISLVSIVTTSNFLGEVYRLLTYTFEGTPPAIVLPPVKPATSSAGTSGSSTSSVFLTSNIDGEFEGWSGQTIVKLMNGQSWQQTGFEYAYTYRYSPTVTIYKTGGTYEMDVAGVSKRVRVTQTY